MDYEKEYKEAIERAETLIEKLESAHIKGFIYHIFPELKEDKDKQIKFLIKSCVYASDITPEGRKEIFAWLEKQNSPVLSNSSNIGKSEKIEPKKLEADKVIGWLIRYMPIFWDTPCNPQRIVEQFKEDFEI